MNRPALRFRIPLWLALTALPGAAVAAPPSVTESARPEALATAWRSLGAPSVAQHPVEQARALLKSDAWRRFDPTLGEDGRIEARWHRFGRRAIVRGRVFLGDVPVEGADRILRFDRHGGVWVLTSAETPVPLRRDAEEPFRVGLETAVQAAHAAVARQSATLFIPKEAAPAFARPVWRVVADHLEPFFRVRVPTVVLSEMRDVWVHGRSGAVYLVERSARSQEAPTAAQAFLWVPSRDRPLDTQTRSVDLFGLIDNPIGAPLEGEHIFTANCCKKYTCRDGGSDCSPSDRNEALCADRSAPDALTSSVTAGFPAEWLRAFGVDPAGFPDGVVHVQLPVCAELPRARSKTPEGREPEWFTVPIDVPRDAVLEQGLASEEDPFVEIQTYHSTERFFQHLRTVLEDPSFCLADSTMKCDANGRALRDAEGRPEHPFHISTNFLMPDAFSQSALANVGFQLLAQQRGRTRDNPVVISDFARFDNAVFLPAFDAPPVDVPDVLAPLVAQFARPYDSNIYFQGQLDFGYDGSVIFHEFGHAIVHTYNPDLGAFRKDRYGASAAPGALNEGWSDYFSSSFRDDPAIGAYGAAGLREGELALRNADNQERCPEDIHGRVHDDSEPWSAALWSLRQRVIDTQGEAGVRRLDRVLWNAVAESAMQEDFGRQTERVHRLVEAEFGPELAAEAEQLFAARQLSDCERVVSLLAPGEDDSPTANPHGSMSVVAGNQIGADLGLAPLQFRVTLPAKTPGFTLTLQSAAAGGFNLNQGEPSPLSVLAVETDGPIEWRFEGPMANRAVPYVNGQALATDLGAEDKKLAANGSDAWTYTIEVAPEDACAARTYHIALYHAEAEGAELAQIAAAALPAVDVSCAPVDEPTDTPDPTDEPEATPTPTSVDQGCGCQGIHSSAAYPGLWALAGLLAFGLRRRRR